MGFAFRRSRQGAQPTPEVLPSSLVSPNTGLWSSGCPSRICRRLRRWLTKVLAMFRLC